MALFFGASLLPLLWASSVLTHCCESPWLNLQASLSPPKHPRNPHSCPRETSSRRLLSGSQREPWIEPISEVCQILDQVFLSLMKVSYHRKMLCLRASSLCLQASSLPWLMSSLLRKTSLRWPSGSKRESCSTWEKTCHKCYGIYSIHSISQKSYFSSSNIRLYFYYSTPRLSLLDWWLILLFLIVLQ